MSDDDLKQPAPAADHKHCGGAVVCPVCLCENVLDEIANEMTADGRRGYLNVARVVSVLMNCSLDASNGLFLQALFVASTAAIEEARIETSLAQANQYAMMLAADPVLRLLAERLGKLLANTTTAADRVTAPGGAA